MLRREVRSAMWPAPAHQPQAKKTKTHANAIVAIQKFCKSPKAISYIKTIHKPNKM